MMSTKRIRSFTAVLLILVLLVMMVPLSLHVKKAEAAGDFYVPSADYPTIQSAIDAASAAGGGTVHVAVGTYHERITLKNGVVVQGAGASITTINGDAGGSVVTAVDVDSTGKIDGLSITNGTGTWDLVDELLVGGGMYNSYSSPTVTNCAFLGNTATWGAGGGMSNFHSSPTVANCTFSGNSAGDGGGMYNWESSPMVTNCTFSRHSVGYRGGGMYNWKSSPMVTNCTFSDNTASGNTASGGGGMYNEESSPTVTNCIFCDNSAPFSAGGGMLNFYSPSPTLTGCSFSENSATQGGGMYNCGSSPTVTNCTFSDNTATALGGGGMYNVHESSPNVTNCTFLRNNVYGSVGGGMLNFYLSAPMVTNCTFLRNNVYGGVGGGIYNSRSSPVVTKCYFYVNSGDSGGGIYNENSSPTVTNCIFCDNRTTDVVWGEGGAMYNENSSPTVTNCAFCNNSADASGGMCNSNSSPVVTNCILWGDKPNEIDNTASAPVVTYCDVQGGYAGSGNINADPLFVKPSDGDLHLQTGSPCIDKGSNSAPALPATDIDGQPRIIDGNGDGTATVDMGADEYLPALMEGDVNGDGYVTLSDSTCIRQYLLGLRTLTPDQLKCADTNDDGKVSLSDSTHIRQWLLDPDGHLGILYKPLWQSPADDDMARPVPRP